MGDQEVEETVAGDIQYVRDGEGVWRYGATGLPVPGARDMTLSDRFRPKLIVSADSMPPERVVVSGEEVGQNPEILSWCLKVGQAVRSEDGVLIEVLVPYEEWQAHERIPGAIVAPEHSEDPAKRELAEAERIYREADRRLEEAAEARAEMLRRYADRLTRQQAREITGLSVGRIQQLIQGPRLSQEHRMFLEALKDCPPVTLAEIQTLVDEKFGFHFIPPDGLRKFLSQFQEQQIIERRGTHFALTSLGDAILSDV